MGAIRPVRPVNLICGLISNDQDIMARAVRMLSDHAGPTDLISEPRPFDTTDYYELEMGQDLKREFASFERLINPDELAHLKIITNELEKRICYQCGLSTDRRLVNLDPGYITLSKLILATTKDYSHRVYLGQGIYAESTLHYEKGQWLPWPWTYPDYADTRYHGFFKQVRERYKDKLSARGSEDESLRGPGE